MANQSLYWVTCDTPGCESSTRDHAHEDDGQADIAADKLGWSHYTKDHKGFDIQDVCPACLASRPDLAALCATEEEEGL